MPKTKTRAERLRFSIWNNVVPSVCFFTETPYRPHTTVIVLENV